MGDTSTVEITERFLDTYELPEGVERARLWDSKLPGFGVTVGRRRVSFVVQRRVKAGQGNAEQKNAVLGHWAPGKLRALDAGLRDRTLTVAIARGKAIEWLGQMRRGEDPRGDEAPHVTPTSGPTLRDGLKLHTSNMRKKQCSERSIETMEDEVARLLPTWLDKPIVALQAEHVRALHDELSGEGKRMLANRVASHVSAIWNTLDGASNDGLPGKNPARKKAVERNPYIPARKRVEDLPAWNAIVQTLAPIRRDLQTFCLFTGMRNEAARHVRWEHVDEDARTLTVPKPKGGRRKEFVLPLPSTLITMLRKRRDANAIEFAPWGGDSGWVFPSLSRANDPTTGRQSVQALAEPKEYRQTERGRKRAKARLLPGLHSLRNTYLSVAAEVGISDIDRHVLVNHSYARQSVNQAYIKQSLVHLADCQRTIERALLAHLKGEALAISTPKRKRRRARA